MEINNFLDKIELNNAKEFLDKELKKIEKRGENYLIDHEDKYLILVNLFNLIDHILKNR